VLEDGSVYATAAKIDGTINATSGKMLNVQAINLDATHGTITNSYMSNVYATNLSAENSSFINGYFTGSISGTGGGTTIKVEDKGDK
jgi:hypothetical protein